MNFRWILATGLLATSFYAQAADSTVCNRCGTVELQGKARDLGNGDHYLFDMTYRKLTHLRVTGMASPCSGLLPQQAF